MFLLKHQFFVSVNEVKVLNNKYSMGNSNDTISDMLTRLRNGYLANKTIIALNNTRLTRSIADVLAKEGFLSNIESNSTKGGTFNVTLSRGVKHFERMSTPGVRKYVNHKEVPPVLNGMGIAVISTSQGIMTDRMARTHCLGGELLCKIW